MPKLPPKPCLAPNCQSYAAKRGYCAEHQREAKAKSWNHDGKNRHERGYGSKWEKARKVALKRDQHLCQVCIAKNVYTLAKEVDHITPKVKGGTDALDNLQAICHKCHREKTSAERIG